jgi:hypothetical protein
MTGNIAIYLNTLYRQSIQELAAGINKSNLEGSWEYQKSQVSYTSSTIQVNKELKILKSWNSKRAERRDQGCRQNLDLETGLRYKRLKTYQVSGGTTSTLLRYN